MVYSSEANLPTKIDVVAKGNTPLNTPEALWSDYAKGWLSLCKTPIELFLINEPRHDAVFTEVYKLGRAVDAIEETHQQAMNRLECLRTARIAREEELRILQEELVEAKDSVKMKAKDQQVLQANAARAISQHRSSEQALEKEKWEWQVAVGIGADILFKAGIEYSDSLARWNQCINFQKQADRDIVFTDQARRALQEDLDIKKPQWLFCVQQIANAVFGMTQQWKEVIDWGPNANAEEFLQIIEDYLKKASSHEAPPEIPPKVYGTALASNTTITEIIGLMKRPLI